MLHMIQGFWEDLCQHFSSWNILEQNSVFWDNVHYHLVLYVKMLAPLTDAAALSYKNTGQVFFEYFHFP